MMVGADADVRNIYDAGFRDKWRMSGMRAPECKSVEQMRNCAQILPKAASFCHGGSAPARKLGAVEKAPIHATCVHAIKNLKRLPGAIALS